MRVDYKPERTMFYLVPENEDERFQLETIYRERMVLVNDSKVTLDGDLQKLAFKVYVRK